MKSTDKLLEISGEPLAGPLSELSWRQSGVLPIRSELNRLLSAKNGFFAFESALLVLPSRSSGGVPGLDEWNASLGWRRHYGNVLDGLVFFALDLFCGQFGAYGDSVVRLHPESGEVEVFAPTLEAWAARVLANYDFETGWPLAHEWQVRNGSLPVGSRLVGRKPFVLGGDYVVGNLVPLELSQAAEKLGGLYRQIKDAPDGTTVTLKGWVDCEETR